MIVKLKQKHIDSGVRGSCWRCPIVKALEDAGFTDVIVMHIIRMMRGEEMYFFATPPDVVFWITNYESGGQGDPIEFEIPIAA